MADQKQVVLSWTNEKDPLTDSGDENKTAFVIDCAISTEIQRSAQVTAHPIEDGSQVHDHIVLEPRKLTLTGLISNYPIVAGIGGQQKIFFSTIPILGMNLTKVEYDAPADADYYFEDRAKTAYDLLNDIFLYRRLLTIVTDLEVFKNMACTEATFPRDAKTAEALRFSLAFTELRFVRAEYVDMAIPPKRASIDVKHSAAQPKDTGTKSPEAKESSILYDVNEATGGALNP